MSTRLTADERVDPPPASETTMHTGSFKSVDDLEDSIGFDFPL
jgi:hypothetical protein